VKSIIQPIHKFRNKHLFAIKYLVLFSIILAFLDEGVRKVTPGHSVMITSMKSALLFVVGLHSILSSRKSKNLIFPFVPWIVYHFISSSISAYRNHSYILLLGTHFVYMGPILLLAAGSYIGARKNLMRKLIVIMVVGLICVAVVGIMQEFARGTLSPFFSYRLYRAKHSMASGYYVDSLFASPQNVAVMGAVSMIIGILGGYSARNTDRAFLWILFCILSILITYLSRVRTGMLLLVLGFSMVYFLSNRIRFLNRRVCHFAVASLIIITSCAFFFPSVTDGLISRSDIGSEMSYYSSLFDPYILLDRATVFAREIEYLPKHDFFFGYGAGWSGSLSRFATANEGIFAKAHDSGLFLIYCEFGLLGIILFVAPVLLKAFTSFAVVKRTNFCSLYAIGSISITLILLIWFLVKSHAILANSFSSILLFGSLGICHGILVNNRTAEMRDAYHNSEYLEQASLK